MRTLPSEERIRRQRLRCKRYYEQNRDKVLSRNLLYKSKRRNEMVAYTLGWVEKNRGRRRKYINQWSKQSYRNKPSYRVAHLLMARIGGLVHHGYRSCRTQELVGCTIERLLAHLESLFLPGMSWINHGRYGWHVDHVRPCSSFDLNDPQQQKDCFHWTNLQPLWWRDNLSKGARHVA